MTTVSRDDIKELRGDLKEVREQGTETAVNVASLKSTMEASLKQSATIVGLLQGDGQRTGLVGTVAKHETRLDNHDGNFRERRDSTWKVFTIATTIALAGASAVAWFMVHFSQGH